MSLITRDYQFTTIKNKAEFEDLPNNIQMIMQKCDEIFAKTKFDIGIIKGYDATMKLKKNTFQENHTHAHFKIKLKLKSK